MVNHRYWRPSNNISRTGQNLPRERIIAALYRDYKFSLLGQTTVRIERGGLWKFYLG